MKYINIIKFTFGIILSTISIISAIDFFNHYFGKSSNWAYVAVWLRGSDGGASYTPIFFGLCAIAGAIIIASIKSHSK